MHSIRGHALWAEGTTQAQMLTWEGVLGVLGGTAEQHGWKEEVLWIKAVTEIREPVGSSLSSIFTLGFKEEKSSRYLKI